MGLRQQRRAPAGAGRTLTRPAARLSRGACCRAPAALCALPWRPATTRLPSWMKQPRSHRQLRRSMSECRLAPMLGNAKHGRFIGRPWTAKG